jgi:hypothetical protein
MPNTKISALTSSTTPLAGTEVLPVVQSSTTTQVSVANLTAGRAVSGLSFSAATFGAPASTTLSLQANATTYATILGAGTNNGFFGIGTTSPQARLQVLDTLKISNAGQSQGSLILGDGSSTSFNVGLARWNGVTNAAGTSGMGYFAQGSVNGGGHYFYTDDAAVGSMTLRVSISPAVGDLKILTGNVIINTAAKGITTGSSISLNFGTNTSTTGMTLDTSNNLNVLGSYTANSVAVPTISSTSTLTNKRVTPRVSTTTSSATPTINTDNVDVYGLTAQAVDITSFSTNLSGTPTDGQLLRIYIVGTAARAITWGASFEASTTPLPTTTVTTNRLDVGFVWNAATSKWRCLASA